MIALKYGISKKIDNSEIVKYILKKDNNLILKKNMYNE